MLYFRLFLHFGLLIICFSSSAQKTDRLDSLRELTQQYVHKPYVNSRDELAIKEYLHEAKIAKNKEDIIIAYQQLATINYRRGKVNSALRYYKLYALEYGRLTDLEKSEKQRFEKNLFENEIKALALKAETLEIINAELKALNDEYQQQNRWIYLGLRIIIGIAILLLSGWIYYRIKQPKKINETVDIPAATQTLAEVLTATKDQLAKTETELDLSDILVQQIIEQPMDFFSANKSIRKKFLIHQPKKLAGGDGLFITSVDHKTLVAVFDTPGHGAAGGLLSSRVCKLLTELTSKHKMLTPNLILSQIDVNLLSTFPAGVPFNEGIKMAICLYDSRLKTVTFSGANLDLFIVQRGTLNKLMGVSQNLLQGNEPSRYFNTEVAVTKGINFYLSTNGFWQQTGGHNRKALGSSSFEKAVESLASQPIMEHEQVLSKIFNDWKGGNEQDDDVLILGFGF